MKLPLNTPVSAVLLLLVSGAFGQPAGDKISSLPGVKASDLGTQYSGYINIDETTGKNLHYWFVESTSGKAEEDPLVLWLNGGPGCSSMEGLMYELGPYRFAPNFSNETVELMKNPYSWTRRANIIFLDAPFGVGFSEMGTAPQYWSDDQTAADNYQFLKNWFQAFPTYADRPFWITGESYAGIYVPTLAHLVNADSNINFKGVMVGNGVTDYDYDNQYVGDYPLYYGHGMISEEVFRAIQKYCPDVNSTLCVDAMVQAEDETFWMNIYDIYGTCYANKDASYPRLPTLKINRNAPSSTPPCANAYAANIYLNLPEVKAAIHVNQSIEWTLCSDTVNTYYNSSVQTVIPIYRELIASNKRILIYSGNTDGAVPYTSTVAWLKSMKLKVKTNNYMRGWSYLEAAGNQLGGVVTEYDGLTFVTVHGSGHMVPQYKPAAAYHMFSQFLNGHSM